MASYCPEIAENLAKLPENFKEIGDIDDLLRCPICYEMMDGAMMAPGCSHTYCSLCIRRYIGYKTQCPTCSKSVSEPELINNRIVDELIMKYSSVRSKLLKVLVSSHGNQSNGPNGPFQTKNALKVPDSHMIKEPNNECSVDRKESDNSTDENRSRQITSPSDSSSPKKSNGSNIRGFCSELPRFRSFGNKENVKDLDKPKNKIRPQRKRKPITYDKNSDSDVTVDLDSDSVSENVDSDDSDVKVVSFKGKMKGKKWKKPSGKTAPDSNDIKMPDPMKADDEKANTLASEEKELKLNGSFSASNVELESPASGSKVKRVACPVCAVSISEKHINLHLDRCLSGDNKSPRASTSVFKKRKPMPNLVYNLLNDKELRKKLVEVSLPTQGNRKMMENRHLEFTLLYNATCDSLKPKSVVELVAEVQKAEKLRSTPAVTHSATEKLVLKKGATKVEIDTAQKAYVKKHQSQFSELIKQAKMRANVRKKKKVPTATLR